MAIPSRIDHFEILRELGRGGMGKVYLGRDTTLGRQVAIKVVTFDEPENEKGQDERRTFCDRLVREAKIAAALDHPGIVTILHANIQGDQPYVVMQYIDGKTLEELLEPDKPFDLAEAQRILREAADALDYAHENGVIHRDIKPPNIMLARSRAVKICDFGIAKSAMLSSRTSSMLMGTPHYMAPEQLMYRPAVRRTDQWALAVVAYRLLTGKMPFHGEDLRSLAAMIVGVPPGAPQEVNPQLPAKVNDVLARALSKDAAARYATCSEFAADLASAMEPPSLPRRPSPAEIAADVAAAKRYYDAWQLDQALPLFRKAADAGNGESAWYLGIVYDHGMQGLPEDDAQAVYWYRKAADAGDRGGMNDLGFMCEKGLGGLPKDDAQAVYWYRKAADAGSGQGMANLGIMLAKGRGGLARDDAQATYWYRKAADADNPQGMCSLGRMYDEGRGGLPKDDVQALYWYRKAAENGDAGGMTGLASMYQDGRGGLPKDDAQAVYWHRRAAKAGSSAGMNNLGNMYRNGCGGLPKDHAQAVSWYRKAADAGSVQGMANLGAMYENGGGLPKDLNQAIELYRKAADLGDEYAQDALKRLGH